MDTNPEQQSLNSTTKLNFVDIISRNIEEKASSFHSAVDKFEWSDLRTGEDVSDNADILIDIWEKNNFKTDF